MMAEIFLSFTHPGIEIKWLPLVLSHPPFLLMVLLHPHLLNMLAFMVVFSRASGQLILAWVGSLAPCSACCQGCLRTCSSWGVYHCVFRYRDLFFPLRVLNNIEEGLVGISQVQAPCSHLCLPGIARVTAFFLQIFY